MRIASLAPSVTIMLQELGVADQIVACTHICPLSLKLRKKLAIGSFSVLDEKKLAATKPDIVITATLVQAKGTTRLKDSGYNVLHLDPRSLFEIAENYAELGSFVGQQERGEALKQQFLADLNAFHSPASHTLPKVYMEEWHEPPFVSGNWVPDIVTAAGGQPVLIEPGQASREITLEELAAADPDMIVQHVCLPPGHDWSAHRQKLLQQLRQRPGWDQLRAVQENRVFALDDTPFNTPTRGTLKGIVMLNTLIELS